ncbi:MAG: hypothetical protein ACRCZF_23300, partial [Gemmataceae bacterium]
VFRQPTIDGASHVFLRYSNSVSWTAEAGPNQPRNPTLATAKTFHDAFAQEFISHEGIGRSRIPRMAFDDMPRQWIELALESEGSRLRAFGPKKHEPRYDEGTQRLHYSDGQSTRVREQVWVLQKFELMKTGAEPRAYVSDIWSMDHGSMKRNFESMKTRVVNEFEKTAIEQLKKNEEIVLKQTGKEMFLVGAVRAQEACLECHKVAEKALLGAFTYTLKLRSETTPKEHRLKNLEGLSEATRGAIEVIEATGGQVRRAGNGPITEWQLGFVEAQLQKGIPPEDWIKLYSVPHRDAALSVLDAFPDLTLLDVSFTLVTDASLEAIAKLPKLQKLVVKHSKITPTGIEQFRAKRPEVDVVVAVPLPPRSRGR